MQTSCVCSEHKHSYKVFIVLASRDVKASPCGVFNEGLQEVLVAPRTPESLQGDQAPQERSVSVHAVDLDSMWMSCTNTVL